MSWGIFTRLGAMVAVGLVLVGCDSVRGAQEPVTTSADLMNFAPGCMKDAVVLREYYKETWGNTPAPGTQVKVEAGEGPTARRIESTAPDYKAQAFIDLGECPRVNETRKNYRDQVIAYRLTVLNHRFKEFTTELREAKVGLGLGIDILDSALDLAGTVFGGAATKSILAAASGAANAGRNSVDVNVFYKQALPAIVAKMEANRDTSIRQIREKQPADVNEYPLDAALDDLSSVERASSIERAIADITEDTKREAKKADQAKQQVVLTYTIAETTLKKQHAARFSAVDTKLKDAPDNLILSIMLKKIPFRDSERESMAKKLERPAADRSSAAVAREILRDWAHTARTEEELALWESFVGIK